MSMSFFFVVTFVNLQYWPPEPCGPLRCGSVGQGCPRRSLDQTAMQNMQNDFLSMQKKSRHKKSRSTLFFPCIIAFDKRNENIANELSRILAQTLAQCTSRLPLSTRAWISQSFCFFLLMISFTRLWKFCCSIWGRSRSENVQICRMYQVGENITPPITKL